MIFISWFLFTAVNTDEPPPLPAHRPANGTVGPADPRSVMGRVPPYQPPAMGNGPISMQGPPVFRPHSPYTRVEAWNRKYTRT